MPTWKQILLSLYYHGSYPIRLWNGRCAAMVGRAPCAVLFYHRIADDHVNDWTATNAMFVQQIAWLRSRFELISLEETQRRIRRDSNRPSVSITFDDGYAENCEQAIPWLIKEGIPCTYFVTLQNVLDGEPFTHDLIQGNRFAPNTIDQVKMMADAGIEIGAHTYTHADLGPITDRRLLHYEVVAAGEELQQLIGHPVRYFAAPIGQIANLNPDVFELGHEAGYEAVCSAYGGLNYPGDDAFHLQRIAVDNNMIHLKNWVTGDPRKRFMRRYEYTRPAPGKTTPQDVTPDRETGNQETTSND